jgi:methionyl-tRNA formyltransferase
MQNTAEKYPRIVFVGAHVESVLPLQYLLSRSEHVVGLFTLDASGLSQMSGGADLTQIVRPAHIPVMRGRNANDPKAVDWIESLNPDILLVVGWTQLIKPHLLSVPRIAALGFHASLLPKYRGRAPVNWAILNGETETGNTLMVLEPGADEGDIVCQRRILILYDDDCRTVYEKVSQTECEMLDEVLALIRQGHLPRTQQDSTAATVMPKRRPEDGLITWSWTSSRLYDWVRALTHPYPGAFTFLDGQKIMIWKATIAGSTTNDSPGTITLDSDGWPLVVTGSGYLRLLQVECESNGPINGLEAARSFLNSASFFQPTPTLREMA